jgi:hypothetical protein
MTLGVEGVLPTVALASPARAVYGTMVVPVGKYGRLALQHIPFNWM